MNLNTDFSKLPAGNTPSAANSNYYIRAIEFIKHHQYDQAWPLVMRVLNEDPDDAKALWLAGVCQVHMASPGVATTLFRRAVANDPKQPNCWLAWGAAMHDLHRYDDAEEIFHVVIGLHRDDPVAYANLASVCIQTGRHHEAFNWTEEALKRDPNNSQALAARGFACLALGRWGEGFPLYDEMLGGTSRKRRVYRIPEEPEWDGTKGQTVVVQCEQGLGDEISFASMVPDLLKDAGKVLIDCDPKAEGLFRRSFPDADVYGTRREVNLEWPKTYSIEAHVSIGSLGKFYRKKDSDFPRTRYLETDPALRAKWRGWLDQFDGLKVGIAWLGGSQLTNWKKRSVTLEDFAPILQEGATYIDLSYQDTTTDVAAWNEQAPHIPIIKPALDEFDYDDTAALVDELDLVISVTTTVIHLAGALGKKCWVLVPTAPQWRYGLSRDDMIWYPPDSVRLFRQAKGEDGMGFAINRLAEEYEGLLRQYGAGQHRIKAA